MPPSLHAVLGASSAKRWLACPPSARLNERLQSRFGEATSPFAAEGTKAHALGEAKIRLAVYKADGMTAAKHSRMSAEEQESYTGINEFRYTVLRDELGVVPKDMEQATDTYCDVVIGKYLAAKEQDPSAQILLEQHLDYSEWVPSGFGTGDCCIISDSLLEVIDYKHGKGIPVSAVDNPQLRLYGLGAVARFHSLFDFDHVRMTIVQPRLDSLSEETLSCDELLQWAKTEVVERADLAWKGLGEFTPGDHCRFCAAKSICSARVAEAMKAFRYGFEAPGVLPDEQIPEVLKVLDVAEDWIKDIRSYAESQAVKGQKWTGFKLVHGKKPNRAWTDAGEVKAQLLRAGYPVSQFEKTTLKPVGDVEKALGKKAFTALVGSFVSQGEGKLTLVPEDDKRLEYSSADVAFADLTSDT